MGHIHLHVSDLKQAQAFYCDGLGFDLIASLAGSALFVSAGGYHHHVGLNVWAGVGAPPPPDGSAGLRHYEIVLPGAGALADIVARLERSGIATQRLDDAVVVSDPSQNAIHLLARQS
jgi:catechol 2,3-dioxygenase